MNIKRFIINARRVTKDYYYNSSFKYEPNTIQEYLLNNFLHNRIGHFHIHYREWTMKRINKILEIFPIEFFKNKRILILGDGIGNFSRFFAMIGANVTMLEGRLFNINFLKLRNFDSNIKMNIKQFDLDKDFTKFGRFDLIINFGLIEVINNIHNLLECCAKMADIILLETLVCDSLDKNYIGHIELNTEGIDNGLKEKCCRPSPFFIENFFSSKGFNIERYFDENLNTEQHKYDWKHKNDYNINESNRRFWVFRKSK